MVRDLDAIAIDHAHVALIKAVAMAAKPKQVLELGVGSGRVTRALADALAFNGQGYLTAVDSWSDFDGKRPPHLLDLPDSVVLVTGLEHDVVKAASSDYYDLVVSDADHNHAGQWLPETLRIVKPGGWLFFHDTNAPNYQTLFEIPERLRRRGFLVSHFTESTRPDERCSRGLLMAQKPLA